MYVAEISVRLSPDADPDDIYGLLGTMQQNGQILSKHLSIVQAHNRLKIFVLLPAADSLDKMHDNKGVRKERKQLSASGLTHLRVQILGTDPTSSGSDTDTCSDRNDYILFTNFLTLQSPLRCGNCFNPVPLYTIPPTYNNSGHYYVKQWEADYQACDTLWMHSATGEQFALREMSNINSSLTQRGRKLCSQIEESTGKPTYYYLHRHLMHTTLKKEEARHCPGCHEEWLLKEPWHLFDFKCETCRLISNFSWGTSR